MANNKDFILKNGIDIRGNFNANNGLTVGLPFLFQPDYLFQNGENGAWYDPSDLSTLYQDSSGTIPVTDDGDPVGLMLDKSSNNNHASQSTAAARPVYRTDGTLHWLEFDGVDDYLSGTGVIGADDAVQIFVAGSAATTTLNAGFFTLNPQSSEKFSQRAVGLKDGETLKVDARGLGALLSTDMSVDSIFEGQFAGSGVAGVSVAVNGGPFVTNQSSVLVTTSGDFNIGRGVTRIEIDGRIFGIVVRNKHLALEERNKTVSYLASKSGVNLQ